MHATREMVGADAYPARGTGVSRTMVRPDAGCVRRSGHSTFTRI